MLTSALLRKSLVSLAAVVLLAQTQTQARAEWQPGVYMTQAVGQVMESVQNINNKFKYGYDDGVSILASFQSPKAETTFRRPVVKGQRYAILGGGDNDVKDLDIEVSDEDGRVFASDKQNDNAPVVTFTAHFTGMITVKQTLFDAPRGSFCVMAFLRDGGWRVTQDNLVKSVVNTMVACNRIDQKLKDSLYFQSGNNQWAIYGGILRKGETQEISKIALGTGRFLILSRGDLSAKDIDIFVTAGDKTVKDDEPDAEPTVDVNTQEVSSASVKVRNSDSDGPTLILTTVLQVRN